MPEYCVSVEYCLRIDAADEKAAAVAAQLLEPAEASSFAKVTMLGNNIIAVSEENNEPDIHPAISLSKVRTQINGLKQTDKQLSIKIAEFMGAATKMIVLSDVGYENAVFLVSREHADICAPQDIHIEKLPLVRKFDAK